MPALLSEIDLPCSTEEASAITPTEGAKQLESVAQHNISLHFTTEELSTTLCSYRGFKIVLLSINGKGASIKHKKI